MISVTKSLTEVSRPRKRFSERFLPTGVFVTAAFPDGVVGISFTENSVMVSQPESKGLEQAISTYRAEHGTRATIETIRNCHEGAMDLRLFVNNLPAFLTRNFS